MQYKVAFCTDIDIELVEKIEKLITEPIFSNIPRKNGKGIIV